jgi:aryl-alcohol dehydrogenase-like predicted oxidoreductase
MIGAKEVTEKVEKGLKTLDTDYIDILHLHGVEPYQYEACRDVMRPACCAYKKRARSGLLGSQKGSNSTLGTRLSSGPWKTIAGTY